MYQQNTCIKTMKFLIQKDLLYDTCAHEWYIERDDCWDSICNKRCKHCQLWQ